MTTGATKSAKDLGTVRHSFTGRLLVVRGKNSLLVHLEVNKLFKKNWRLVHVMLNCGQLSVVPFSPRPCSPRILGMTRPEVAGVRIVACVH